MKIEIMLDMEAIGEDDTILVQDEFGEYPDCEYVPKSAYDRIEAENANLRELAKSAWGCVNRHVSCDACRMTCGGCTLQSAMRELGIEVTR